MFDFDTVKMYAGVFGFIELERCIEEDRQKYFNFILHGKEG